MANPYGYPAQGGFGTGAGYGAPGGYPGQPAGYPGQQTGYPGQQTGYPGQQPGYPGQQPGYPAPQTGYPGQSYPAPGAYGPPPGVDPQVFQWFQTVDSDRSGRITANELQQALTNANWTQFNPETCRLMIGMFDQDLSGTIDIHEFQHLWNYIHQWKNCFDKYDRDRSGAIEELELMSAFSDMGYRVSQQLIRTIVCKFDIHARRSLSLDNFIQASVMLKSLTDAFKSRDSNLSGVVTMSYEDFMVLVVLNKP